MTFRTFSALVLLLLNKAVKSQDCTNLIENVTSCIIDNVATCSTCNPIGDVFVGGGSSTCDSITSSVCPAIRCCSACEEAAFLYAQTCIVNPLEAIVGTCDLNCSGFLIGERNNTSTSLCLQEGSDLARCYQANAQNCSIGCNFSINASSLPTSACDAVESTFCAQRECCPSCDSEIFSFVLCTISAISNDTFSCNIDNCPSVPTVPTTTPTTPNPVPAPTGTTTPIPSGSSSPPPIAPSPVTAPAPTASLPPTSGCDSEVSATRDCLTQNFLNCAICIPFLTNSTSDIVNIRGCSDLKSQLCPVVNCCSQCANDFQALLECELSNNTLVTDCDLLTCVNGTTLAPTVLSSPVATPPGAAPTPTAPINITYSNNCNSEINVAERCVAQNLLNCARCLPFLQNATSDFSSISSCSDARSQFCPVLDCCPQCADEAQTVFECEVHNITLLTNCALGCAGINRTSASATTIPSQSLSLVATSLVVVMSMFGFA